MRRLDGDEGTAAHRHVLVAAAAEMLEAARSAVPEARGPYLAQAARFLVDLRASCRVEGGPDWAGVSPAYARAIEAVMEQAQVRCTDRAALLAQLGSHVSHLLAQVRPARI